MRISDWRSAVCPPDPTASPLGADACCGSAPAVSSAASPPTGTEGATGTVSPSPLPSADATASLSFVAAAASLPEGADVSPQAASRRSEESRVGTGCVSACKARWKASQYNEKKTTDSNETYRVDQVKKKKSKK